MRFSHGSAAVSEGSLPFSCLKRSARFAKGVDPVDQIDVESRHVHGKLSHPVDQRRVLRGFAAFRQKPLGLLDRIQRRDGVLPDRLLILLGQMRINLFHDLAHAHLRQFFRDHFFDRLDKPGGRPNNPSGTLDDRCGGLNNASGSHNSRGGGVGRANGGLGRRAKQPRWREATDGWASRPYLLFDGAGYLLPGLTAGMPARSAGMASGGRSRRSFSASKPHT